LLEKNPSNSGSVFANSIANNRENMDAWCWQTMQHSAENGFHTSSLPVPKDPAGCYW